MLFHESGRQVWPQEAEQRLEKSGSMTLRGPRGRRHPHRTGPCGDGHVGTGTVSGARGGLRPQRLLGFPQEWQAGGGELESWLV